MNANGSGLVFSTFFGIGFDARVAGVAVDVAGNAYVTGTTQSIYVPVTSGGRTFSGVNNDNAFLLKFNATGQVTYGTYLGGMSSDVATGVAVDGAGHAYVVGNTWLSRDGIAMSRTGTPAQPDPNSAIFKSTDGAQTFVPANHGLDSSIAMAVAIDPQQPDTIYQATYDGGMFKSTDGGGSWLPINSGFGIRPSAWDIAVNPNTPSTLLAIVYSESTNGIRSVFRSLDAGGSWTEVLDDARIIAIAPSSPSIVYADRQRRQSRAQYRQRLNLDPRAVSDDGHPGRGSDKCIGRVRRDGGRGGHEVLDGRQHLVERHRRTGECETDQVSRRRSNVAEHRLGGQRRWQGLQEQRWRNDVGGSAAGWSGVGRPGGDDVRRWNALYRLHELEQLRQLLSCQDHRQRGVMDALDRSWQPDAGS